jgi:hypothetical protein
MKFRDSTGPLLLGIAVFSASLMCLAPLCSGESSSKELEIKAIPTWDVKHDIGPSGPVTDLHCDVGDVSVSSLPTPAPAASIDSTPRGAIAQHTPPSKRSRQTRGNFFRHRFFYVSGAIVRVGEGASSSLATNALTHPAPRPRSRRPTPSSCLESWTSSQTQPTFDLCPSISMESASETAAAATTTTTVTVPCGVAHRLDTPAPFSMTCRTATSPANLLAPSLATFQHKEPQCPQTLAPTSTLGVNPPAFSPTANHLPSSPANDTRVVFQQVLGLWRG